MWWAHQLQHQSVNLWFTKLRDRRLPWRRGPGRLVCLRSPELLFKAFPNSFLASVGEHATQIKHMNRRAGTFLLFIMSLYISFSFWKQVRVLHHRRLRIAAASLGGFTTSLSSVPSAMRLQVLLDETFTYCHLLASDRQSIFLQLPLWQSSQGHVWASGGSTVRPAFL